MSAETVVQLSQKPMHWSRFANVDVESTDDPRLVTCPLCVEVLFDEGGKALYACEGVTDLRCPVCGGEGLRTAPHLRKLGAECLSCGWHYTTYQRATEGEEVSS